MIKMNSLDDLKEINKIDLPFPFKEEGIGISEPGIVTIVPSTQ